MASLKDIAGELNISISLVSKVLNNRMGTAGVSPAMQEAIFKKAEELNYQKNTSALSLRKGTHDTIGVYIHRHGESGSGLLENLVLGIAEVARSQHQKLMLSFFEKPEEFIAMSASIHRGTMDGMIVGGLSHKELSDAVLGISQQGLPVVTIQNDPMHEEITNISMNEAQIGYFATQHLIEQGCTRIGHIYTMDARYEGHCRALKEAGLPVDSELVFDAGEFGFTLMAGEAAAKKILVDGLDVDGLVAESDQQALGAMNTLAQGGVVIPNQIKIIGVDDAAFCRYMPIQISSVSQETESKGRLAMEMLMKLSDGQQVESVTLDPVIKFRHSSGAPSVD